MIKIEDDQIKKVVLNIGKFSGKIFLIVVLPITLFIIIFSGMMWYITLDDGVWKRDEKGRPSTYTENVKIDGEKGIIINREELIKQALLDRGFSEEEIKTLTDQDIIRIFNMNKKLNRIITDLSTCTEAEILWCVSDEYSKYMKKPEELEYLLRAEIVTQYPKIEGLSADKLNGIIQFKRIKTDENTGNESETTLKYISEEKFEEKFKNYEVNGNSEIFDYFTLDDEQNIVIATWTQETGNFKSNNLVNSNENKINSGFDQSKINSEYDKRYKIYSNSDTSIEAKFKSYYIEKQKINYKNMVVEYTLPFEYLWSLLVMGESYNFVSNLAQLAYNSEIVIGIYDTITTVTTENKKEYTENFREKYNKYEDNKLVEKKDWEKKKYDYYEINIIETKTNTIQADILNANTWIVKEEKKYKNTISEDNPYVNSNTIPDENWSDNGTNIKEYDEKRKEYIVEKDKNGNIIIDPQTGYSKYEEVEKVVRIKEEFYKEKKITGQINTTTTTTNYNKYEEVSSKLIEKTDLDPNTEKNFVKLLREDSTAYYLITDKKTLGWLVDILENNQQTANMVDLTLYLLNKATQSGDYFDESKKTFDELWNEIVISRTPTELVGQDFIVDTTKSNSKLVITDREVLIKAIEDVYTGKAKENLLSEVDSFIEMQDKYNVNAIFAIAVTQVESSCGTNFTGAIPEHTYNWMSVTGAYKGNSYRNPNSSNQRTWRVYPNFKEATLDFGDLIANSAYYLKNGKNTVMSISPIYCGGTEWGEKVISYMAKIYNATGISFGGTGGGIGQEIPASGNSYNSIYVSSSGKTYKNYKQPIGSDWCGITSTAIILSAYGFDEVTPSYVHNTVGYNWRSFLYQKLGIPFVDYVWSNSYEQISSQLREGKPVIVFVPANNGKYSTNQQHFFTLLDISPDGQQFYVSDPAGNQYSNGRDGWNSAKDVLQYVTKYIKL